MSANKKTKQKFLSINRWQVWLFCLFSATLILACTSDLNDAGAPLVGPSFGITIIPQKPQILKTGNQTFTAELGVAPYTYSLSATAIGTIVPATGVFTALEIAGTATVTAVDSKGLSGTTTVTVLPTQLVIAPGSAILTVAGDQAFTATINSGSGLIVCSISRDDSTGETAIPTVAANAAVCTATASAIPAAGTTETFTILITDTNNGDHGSAKLTLGAP